MSKCCDADCLSDCLDCGKCTLDMENFNYYMVKDSLWIKFGALKNMLCLRCLETRMNRPINMEDLPEKLIPINYIKFGIIYYITERLHFETLCR